MHILPSDFSLSDYLVTPLLLSTSLSLFFLSLFLLSCFIKTLVSSFCCCKYIIGGNLRYINVENMIEAAQFLSKRNFCCSGNTVTNISHWKRIAQLPLHSCISLFLQHHYTQKWTKAYSQNVKDTFEGALRATGINVARCKMLTKFWL